jgi:MYXO-CTERM domain-containing protein
MLAYQEEGANAANPGHALFVINNTFVNDKGSGTFVNVGGSVSTPAVLKNNIFFGGGTITNQGSADQANNESGTTTCLVDAPNFDYHLVAGSPCVDAGADPGTGAGMALLPQFQYVHPADRESRTSVGTIDIGAYELGGGSAGAGGAGGSGGGNTGGSAGSAAGGAAGAGTGGGATGGASSGGSSSGGAAGSGGGKSGGSSSDDGGCGCRTSPAPASQGLLWLLLAVGLMRRRR